MEETDIQIGIRESSGLFLFIVICMTAFVITLGIIAFIIFDLYGEVSQLNDNSEWTCITQICEKNYTEDDWVKNNCALTNGNMTCSFIWNNQAYSFLLSNVNVTYMLQNQVGKYCDFKCQTEVLIRNYKEIK